MVDKQFKAGDVVRIHESAELPLLGVVLRADNRRQLAYIHWNVRETYIPGSLAGCRSLEEYRRLERTE